MHEYNGRFYLFTTLHQPASAYPLPSDGGGTEFLVRQRGDFTYDFTPRRRSCVTAVADSPLGPFQLLDSQASITPEDFQRLIDAHLCTVFHTCRVAAPLMATQRHGAIVNTGSTAALGIYGGTGYPAGKAAVHGLTLAIAAELKQSGVRANVICPGARTRLSEGGEYIAHLRDLYARLARYEGADSAPPPPPTPTPPNAVDERGYRRF